MKIFVNKGGRSVKKGFMFKLRRVLKWAVLATLIAVPAGYFLYQSGWFGPQASSVLTPPEQVKGSLVTLRIMKEDYFVDYHNMFSSTVRKFMEFPDYITLDYTIRYLKMEMEKSKRGEQILYAIFDNKENKMIGAIEVREKNDYDPGQLGNWVNENYWGGGRYQEALKLMTQTYFKVHPEAKSYNAHVRLWNKRSYFGLKKFGFKDAGYYYEGGQPARYILEYRK